jgi:hypothetical protein
MSNSVRAIASLMAGTDTTILLSPDEEILLTVVRFDHVVRGVSETQTVTITANWRRAETLGIKPLPTVLHTSLKDIGATVETFVNDPKAARLKEIEGSMARFNESMG